MAWTLADLADRPQSEAADIRDVMCVPQGLARLAFEQDVAERQFLLGIRDLRG